jgi:flagellar basal-body rod protein FlgG
MNEALYVAATGLQAEQSNLETIANNLANVNTTGYKRSITNFQELMYREAAGVKRTQTSQGPTLGSGIGIASVVKSFAAGTITSTGSPLDVAINGNGFLEVTLPDGSTAYTRGGSLQVNQDGQLTTLDGNVLGPGISVAANYQSLAIASDGTVSATYANNAEPVVLGRLNMSSFANPQQLTPMGGTLYTANDLSGDAVAGRAGDDGFGTLVQGSLEGSNVSLVDEMVNMTVAQRTYGLDAKAFQAADEVASITNELRK